MKVKIWFQNRRMKWKRSKKAQQEAKEKKNNTGTSSATQDVPSLSKLDNKFLGLCNSKQKKLASSDQQQHLITNINEICEIDQQVTGMSNSRRSTIYTEDGQNTDMFRPYVV